MIKSIYQKMIIHPCLILIVTWTGGLAFGQPTLETKTQAIRNGNVYPVNLQLTAKQRKAIGWLSTGGGEGGRFCTATVISENTVITAKHCFYGKDPIDLTSDLYFNIAADQNPADQENNLQNTAFDYDQTFPFSQSDIKTFGDLDIALITFTDGSEPFNRSFPICLDISFSYVSHNPKTLFLSSLSVLVSKFWSCLSGFILSSKLG